MTITATIKQIEITRYAKAMVAAGIAEWRLETKPTGDVTLIVGPQSTTQEKSDWDK